MSSKKKEAAIEDVLQFATDACQEMPGHSHKAVTYFLYKEILKNRLMLLEFTDKDNRAAAQHTENEINDLNIKLMELLKK